LLPKDERYWSEIDYTPQWSFEAAARKSLADEAISSDFRGVAGRLEERFVQLLSPKL